MKTAVSLPDELFRKAELRAKKLRVSRSQLYAQAIADFLARGDGDLVTQKLDQVYSRIQRKVDPALQRVQIALLKDSAW